MATLRTPGMSVTCCWVAPQRLHWSLKSSFGVQSSPTKLSVGKADQNSPSQEIIRPFLKEFSIETFHHDFFLQKLLYFEWSPPWHFKTALLDFMSAWSCQVRVDIQLISWNPSGWSQLHRLTGGNLLTFFLTYLLTFVLTYLLTFFLTCFRHSFWHCFWHSVWHSFWYIVWHSFCHSFWHIFWHSVWHLFWHSFWHSFWHISWHSVWHSFWHSFWQSFWHSFWHIFWHSFWAYSNVHMQILLFKLCMLEVLNVQFSGCYLLWWQLRDPVSAFADPVQKKGWLVGGWVSTHLKNICQIGWFPQGSGWK